MLYAIRSSLRGRPTTADPLDLLCSFSNPESSFHDYTIAEKIACFHCETRIKASPLNSDDSLASECTQPNHQMNKCSPEKRAIRRMTKKGEWRRGRDEGKSDW